MRKKRAHSISTKNYGPLGALVGEEHASNILSPPSKSSPHWRLCRNDENATCVILNKVKNLMHSLRYTTQILRLTPHQNDIRTQSLEGEVVFFVLELSSNKLLRSCFLYREEDSKYGDSILSSWLCAQRSRSG